MADTATDPSAASGPWLFLFRRSPYSSQAAQEALDTLLVAAAYDRPVRVLFLDEAVLQLVAAQTLT
ncbi:MAG: DsrE family protein, partial [Pseudomonadota bacterium]